MKKICFTEDEAFRMFGFIDLIVQYGLEDKKFWGEYEVALDDIWDVMLKHTKDIKYIDSIFVDTYKDVLTKRVKEHQKVMNAFKKFFGGEP